MNGVETAPACRSWSSQASCSVGDLALGLGHVEVDLALVGAVDIGGDEQRHVASGADDGRIGDDDVAQRGARAVGDEGRDLPHGSLVLGIDAEHPGDGVAGEDGIIGRDEDAGIGVALALLVDDVGAELDRDGDRGLDEGRVALGDDRDQEDGEEDEPDGDGRDAIEAEAALGRVAALEAEIAAGGRDGAGLGPGESGVGHSYCSRYLRTM